MVNLIIFLIALAVIAVNISCASPRMNQSDVKASDNVLGDEPVLSLSQETFYSEASEIIPPRARRATNSPLKLKTLLAKHSRWKGNIIVHIDSGGKIKSAECISDNPEINVLYANWVKTWMFFPGKYKNKKVACIWQFKVPPQEIMVETRITIEKIR